MSQSKENFSQNLLASTPTPSSAAEKIPILARGAVSDRAKQTLNLVSVKWATNVLIRPSDKYPEGREVC